jgi:hypothetical protein
LICRVYFLFVNIALLQRSKVISAFNSAYPYSVQKTEGDVNKTYV